MNAYRLHHIECGDLEWTATPVPGLPAVSVAAFDAYATAFSGREKHATVHGGMPAVLDSLALLALTDADAAVRAAGHELLPLLRWLRHDAVAHDLYELLPVDAERVPA